MDRRERSFRLRRRRASEPDGGVARVAVTARVVVVVRGTEPDAFGGDVSDGFVGRSRRDFDERPSRFFNRERRLLGDARRGHDVAATFQDETQAKRDGGSQRAVVESHDLETRVAPGENLGGENFVRILRRRLPPRVFEFVLDAVPQEQRRVGHDVRARRRGGAGKASQGHGELHPGILSCLFHLGLFFLGRLARFPVGGFGLGLGLGLEKFFAPLEDPHRLQHRRRVRQRQRVRVERSLLFLLVAASARRAHLDEPQRRQVVQTLERLPRLVTKRATHQRVVKRERELGDGEFVRLLGLGLEVRRGSRGVRRRRVALLRGRLIRLFIRLLLFVVVGGG